MPELGRYARELRSRFWKPSVTEEVASELAYHIEMLEHDLVARGHAPAEARRMARERFGDAGRIGDACRDEGRARDRERGRARWLGELALDARQAVRQLRANPRFSVAAIATLAVGLGASTLIFGIASALLLRPLPFPAADRLATAYELSPAGQDWSVSQVNYLDWIAAAGDDATLGAFATRRASLTGDGAPQQVAGAHATHTFFDVLGVAPALGRTFVASEDRPGGDAAVAVISHALWQTRFGGDPRILERSVGIAGERHRIVGVMPPGFDFPEAAQIWTPLAPDPAGDRGDRRLIGVARLADGVTFEQADTRLRDVARRLAASHPDANADWSARLVPMQEWFVPPALEQRLHVLLAAVGLLLLMACVNVASLLVARAGAREREIAVRAALGAGRGRIVRQLLTESLVLAAVGAAAGTLLAAAAVPLVRHTGTAAVPHLATLSVDWRVLLFALAASVATGLLFGLLPALRVARDQGVGAHAVLRGGGRVTGAGAARRALIVTSVALATLLLVSAGLVGSSFLRLMRVELGFAPEQVLTASVSLTGGRYDAERTARFHAELETRLARLPGVVGAGATNIAPFAGGNTAMGWEPASVATARAGDGRVASWRAVTPGYFQALAVPLVRGRLLDDTDRWGDEDRRGSVVISDNLARAGWPDGDAVGRPIALSNGNTYTVVGVVGDVRHLELDSLPSPTIYFAHRQFPWPSMWLTVRTTGDPRALVAAVRREVAAIDPDVPVAHAQPLTQLVADTAAEPRLTTVVFATFAATALLLAAVGLYGIVSYDVVRRRRELGIRLALGATPRRLVRRVLGEGVGLAAIGVAIGVAAALVATGPLAALLYETRPTDPATFAAVAAVLLLVAATASLAPARRAARMDPAMTLRAE